MCPKELNEVVPETPVPRGCWWVALLDDTATSTVPPGLFPQALKYPLDTRGSDKAKALPFSFQNRLEEISPLSAIPAKRSVTTVCDFIAVTHQIAVLTFIITLLFLCENLGEG